MPDEKSPHQADVNAIAELWAETERNCNHAWWEEREKEEPGVFLEKFYASRRSEEGQ